MVEGFGLGDEVPGMSCFGGRVDPWIRKSRIPQVTSPKPHFALRRQFPVWAWGVEGLRVVWFMSRMPPPPLLLQAMPARIWRTQTKK